MDFVHFLEIIEFRLSQALTRKPSISRILVSCCQTEIDKPSKVVTGIHTSRRRHCAEYFRVVANRRLRPKPVPEATEAQRRVSEFMVFLSSVFGAEFWVPKRPNHLWLAPGARTLLRVERINIHLSTSPKKPKIA